MIHNLSETGIKGLTLFNRFFNPDIDIQKKELVASDVFSSSTDASMNLRWIAIMSKHVKCDLAASTGIHNSQSVIKQLLAGATAVQVVSAIYKNGTSCISQFISELSLWMEKNKYEYISDFRGQMSQEKLQNPEIYERTQFMKYFSSRTN